MNAYFMGFAGGPVVENPLANAGVAGSIPGPGKMPRAPRHLSPWAITAEPTL